MKIDKQISPASFQPITITIVVETQEELQTMRNLTIYPNRTSEAIAQDLLVGRASQENMRDFLLHMGRLIR